MTWSIIAHDRSTGCFGIAVATKFFAVGARVPFIAAGVGAVATQGLVNPFYGINGLRLLREGLTADAVVKELIVADEGRDHRQVHVIDARGRIAAHTGGVCIDWNGHVHGYGFSVAGNMLVNSVTTPSVSPRDSLKSTTSTACVSRPRSANKRYVHVRSCETEIR